MHRIDTSTAQVDKFGAGKNGFTGGNPQTGELPTALDADFFDAFQEELATVIEGAGIALEKSRHNQLLTALNKLFSGRLINVQRIISSGTYTPSPGTKSIVVEGVGAGGASGNVTATGATQNAISAAGSNGAYAIARYTSGFGSVPVTIGSGGVPNGAGGGSGGNGGDTVFGSLLTCPGGKGSLVGVASTPPFNNGGAQGAGEVTGTGVIYFQSGIRSPWPTVVAMGQGSNFTPATSTMLGRFGLGGDGVASDASQPTKSGNNGNAGCIIVWEYA